MIRYYTLPPKGIDYPWLFVNMRKYKLLFHYSFEHAIVDSGVEYFFNHLRVKDYPRSYLAWYKHKSKELSKIFGEDRIAIVIPDYPDDYEKGLTYEDKMDNVDKTLRNIEDFISVDGVTWIPVIQSRLHDSYSFWDSAMRVREIVGDYPIVAVGTVCKSKNLSWIRWCLMNARRRFPNSWIHAFGLTLSALRMVKRVVNSFDSQLWDSRRVLWKRARRLIDSFDSMSYSFPRRPGFPSAKNYETRIKYFYAYLHRIHEILGVQLDV